MSLGVDKTLNRWRHYAATALLLLGGGGFAAAAERLPGGAVDTPDEGTAVLLVLPERSERAGLTALRQRLEAAPNDVETATQLARSYLRLASRTGDPRYSGYARAALEPWWEKRSAPPDVLLLRARYRQHRHAFTAALADIERLLRVRPNDPEAWLLKASIERVQGRLDAARQSCRRVTASAGLTTGVLCLTEIEARRGGLGPAQAQLDNLLDLDLADWQSGWAWTLRAETAVQAGDYRAAAEALERSLATTPSDTYRLATYADVLLALGQPSQAVALLSDRSSVDALLLREAIALRRLGDPDWRSRFTQLQDRFEAADRRGEPGHWGTRARAALDLADQPKVALAFAVRNWVDQRELADARLLARAAEASNQPAAAQPVRDWLARYDVQDHQLAGLMTGGTGR